MPLFEYRCRACGHEFEKLVPGPSVRVTCPACGKARVEKRFSTFASRTSSGFTPSSGGKGCSGCTSRNCGSCR